MSPPPSLPLSPGPGARALTWTAILALVLAAFTAATAIWIARLYVGASAEAALLRDQARLTELEIRSLRNEIEADRIVAQRQLADDRQRIAELDRALAGLQAKGGK